MYSERDSFVRPLFRAPSLFRSRCMRDVIGKNACSLHRPKGITREEVVDACISGRCFHSRVVRSHARRA